MANNWKETCARCMEGEIEPRHCEYYGEPKGCNSPLYGEHPSTPNAAAMYSCLLKILAEMIDLGGMERGRKAHFSPDAIAEAIRWTLAAPSRNCDKYATADEALKAQEQMFNDSNFANGECKLGCPECDNPRVGCKIAWLFAPTTEQEGGNNGSK